MKKTAKANIKISQAIGKVLGINFRNEEFSLGTWGDVDNWCRLTDETLVLLECENSGQKHPNTNVVKIYPYLEESAHIRVILIHYLSPENKAPKNRVKLCNFFGKKMEAEFSDRFQYVHLKCQQELIEENLSQHKSRLMKLLKAGQNG